MTSSFDTFLSRTLKTAVFIGGFCIQIGCTSTSSLDYSFNSVPTVGAAIVQQPSLVRCNTDSEALAMSASGLFVGGCERVTATDSYTVTDVRYVELEEGGVWLVTATDDAGAVIIPFPWHDWV